MKKNIKREKVGAEKIYNKMNSKIMIILKCRKQSRWLCIGEYMRKFNTNGREKEMEIVDSKETWCG